MSVIRNLDRKGVILLAVIAVLAVLFAGYCSLCAKGSGDTIYPKVVISEVPMGKLTCGEAEAALREAVQARSPDETHGVVFTAVCDTGNEAVMKVPLSSVETDYASTVAKAWSVGNDSAFFARGATYLSCLVSGKKVLPVYVGGEALDAILSDMDAQIGRVAVQSTWEKTDTQIIIHKGQPGNLLDREGLKKQVLDLLSSGNVVEMESAEPQFTIELTQSLPDELDFNAILDEIKVEMRNAVFDKANKTFQTDCVGVSFDVEAAKEMYDALDWGEVGSVDLILTQPTTTMADIQPMLYQDVLGTCSTNIAGTANRVQNINLAAQYFSGAVLMPGEEFSYNGTVGQRTSARGFLDAPAYVSGETVQETGGGVCQGSSTIYLAALRANLEITERYNHGYICRYVPDGMDATVYYGALDFKFKNNTPFPLKIVGSVSGRTLNVSILGTKTDNLKVEMTNEITGQTDYKTVYKVDPSLPAGSTRVETTPYTGYTVKVYRNIYENGVLKSTTLESNNTYKSRDKVVMVSPANAAAYGISGY